MPRPPKPPPKPAPAELPQNTFVLDNGAFNLKAGFVSQDSVSEEEALAPCHVIPNCLVRTRDRKTYVATECDQITQWGEAVFRRPMEHGQIVNWEAQKEIWDRSFFDDKTAKRDVYIGDPESTTLLLAEAPNTMPALQKNADEIIMEEWGFGGYLRVLGPTLNAYNDLHPLYESEAALKAHPTIRDSPMECLLVVDSGYSHTTITPVFEGRPVQRAIRRLDFGGKHITNLLKETISIRHFDLHQETKIVNDIKEDISFISRDFKTDLDRAWKGTKRRQHSLSDLDGDMMDIDGSQANINIKVDYILPDGIRLLRGFSRPHDPSASAARKRKLNAADPDISEVSMTLGNERFAVPEILFSPSDIGSKQIGLVDCILSSLSVLPPLIQATMLANVLLVGGTGCIPGFQKRLENELRSCVKGDWPVRVRSMSDPIRSTWLGGARLATKYRETVKEYAVTKEEYQEHGSAWISRKFMAGSKIDG